MDISAEFSKGFVSSSSKKNPIHPKHGWCEFCDSANHFPGDQKKIKFPTTVFVSQRLVEIPGFLPQYAEQQVPFFSVWNLLIRLRKKFPRVWNQWL